MGETPTLTVNGQQILLNNTRSVHAAFTDTSGFTEGTQVDEWVVDAIDAELDYETADECHVLRAFVYFKPLDAVNTGSINDSELDVAGWERTGNMLGGDRLGIIYEKRV